MSDLKLITDKDKLKERLKRQITMAVGDKIKLLKKQSTLRII